MFFLITIIIQYLLLSIVIDANSSKREVYIWGGLMWLGHSLLDVSYQYPHYINAAWGYFIFNVAFPAMLPVVIGSALKLAVINLQKNQTFLTRGNTTSDIHHNVDAVYQLSVEQREKLVQEIQVNLEQIQQQKEQRLSKAPLDDLVVKLEELKHDIADEIRKNEHLLGELYLACPKGHHYINSLKNNVRVLGELAKERFLYLQEIQIYQDIQQNLTQKASATSLPKNARVKTYLAKLVEQSDGIVGKIEEQLRNLLGYDQLVREAVSTKELEGLIVEMKSKKQGLIHHINMYIARYKKLIAKVQQNRLLSNNGGSEVTQLQNNIKKLTQQQHKIDMFYNSLVATHTAVSKINPDLSVISKIPQIQQQLEQLQSSIVEFKQSHSPFDNGLLERAKDFVDHAHEATHSLRQAINHCLVYISTSNVPYIKEQLHNLNDQITLFTFDVEVIVRKFSVEEKVNEVEADLYLLDEKLLDEFDLGTHALQLWQDYHPESEETFWELYNELLGVAKLCV